MVLQGLAPREKTITTHWAVNLGMILVLIAASVVLVALSFPPHEYWWLAWVALIPLLLALRRVGHPLGALCCGFLFGIAVLMTCFPWLLGLLGGYALYVYLSCAALPFALFALGEHLLRRSLHPAAYLIMLPVLWIAADYFRCEGWHFQFSWGQLGFTQVTWEAGRALYPLIGVYGVSFLIVAVNGALVALLSAYERRKAWPVLVTAALLIACAFPLQQTVRLRGAHPPVTALVVQDEWGGVPRLLELTYAAEHIHPDLVVWRESAAGNIFSPTGHLVHLRQLTRTLNCTLVTGCSEDAGRSKINNTAAIIAPSGDIHGTYRKRHPVQIIESSVIPGTTSPSFATPVGRLGIAICYDFDYAACTWQLVRNGAELLCVPTYDAESWSDLQHIQHSRMAQTRAAEAGRWVIRATSSGISQIITPRGTLAASIPNGASDTAHADVYPLTQRTPYIRALYRLPVYCLYLSGLMVLFVLVGRLRRK